MARVLIIEYDCGTEYQMDLPAVTQNRQGGVLNKKLDDARIADLAKILNARHDRECDACRVPEPAYDIPTVEFVSE